MAVAELDLHTQRGVWTYIKIQRDGGGGLRGRGWFALPSTKRQSGLVMMRHLQLL